MHTVARRIRRSNRWAVAVAAAIGAAGALLLGSLTIASGAPTAGIPHVVDFSTLNAGRPVAGRMFEGLAIINRTGLTGDPQRFTSVRCDAEVGGRRLHAKRLVYGHPQNGLVQVVVCGWRIPATAAGKTLRYWRYSDPGFKRGAIVDFGGTHIGSPVSTWLVTKP